MDDTRDFAPEWISETLNLDFSDFSISLSKLDAIVQVRKDGWVYAKCNEDFKIVRDIIVESDE